MDILDIVNSHLKDRELLVEDKLHDIVTKLNGGDSLEQLSSLYKVEPAIIKNYLKKENYYLDPNSNKWLKGNLKTEVGDYITTEQISTIPYKLFYGSNLTFIAQQTNVTITTLKESLKRFNYKKRWTYTYNANNQSIIHPDVLKIVHLINSKKYSLEDVAEHLKTDVNELKETLKAANFRKVWTLESNVEASTIETNIEGLKIVRDLDTGTLEYIITSGTKFYTSLQVNTILGINSNYYFNLSSNRFTMNKHFLQLNKEFANKINLAIPSLNATQFEMLYSEFGLKLLAELSNRNGNFIQFRELEYQKRDHQIENQNSITNNQIKNDEMIKNENGNIIKHATDKLQNVSYKQHTPLEKVIKDVESLEKIVNRLNNGESLYDVSNEFVINRKLRVPFVTNLQARLEYEGYLYNKEMKKWINSIKTEKELKNTKKIDTSKKELNIEEIISFLNKENSFVKVVDTFGIKNSELRLLLKSKGYKYDGFFKLWTRKDRNELLKKVSEDLKEGVQTLAELEQRGVNTSALTKEIQHHSVMNQINEKINKNNNEIENDNVDNISSDVTTSLSKCKNEKDVIKNDEHNENNSKNQQVFDVEETKLLRQMLLEWKAEKSSKAIKNDFNLEVTFRLNNKILKQIDNYSEENMISKSMVLEEALIQFFGNEKLLNNENGHIKMSEKDDRINQEKNLKIEKELVINNTANPNNWDLAKGNFLISSILNGTREGRTLKSIIEDVSNEIGISATACQSYWSNKVPEKYKEEFYAIKLDQELNWSDEDMKILNDLIFVEFAHLTPYEVLPIASNRLKRHIDVVRKKLFELQRSKRLKNN
ncbi:hypothetical protein M9R32_13925 [Paenisporosarcina quisquiliarum]|uniref:Uncharacterized protein n=1 Tax=Paenisporosarcina quisquiliarum TaxID=365346 RepID=A0A9X3RDY7_9BACL|nr:hypothetical protein [Paenisporosarcina quisquiliarum]MCZ8538290.1 hypothetical protein [Paenisporosarcina quisquiliarum]